jgi:hypothetical protein
VGPFGSTGSGHLGSFAPTASVIPVHGLLRFDAKMHAGNPILRIASHSERVTKLLVGLWGLTENITLLVGGSRNPEIYKVGFSRSSATQAERPCIRNPLSSHAPYLASCSANG